MHFNTVKSYCLVYVRKQFLEKSKRQKSAPLLLRSSKVRIGACSCSTVCHPYIFRYLLRFCFIFFLLLLLHYYYNTTTILLPTSEAASPFQKIHTQYFNSRPLFSTEYLLTVRHPYAILSSVIKKAN